MRTTKPTTATTGRPACFSPSTLPPSLTTLHARRRPQRQRDRRAEKRARGRGATRIRRPASPPVRHTRRPRPPRAAACHHLSSSSYLAVRPSWARARGCLSASACGRPRRRAPSERKGAVGVGGGSRRSAVWQAGGGGGGWGGGEEKRRGGVIDVVSDRSMFLFCTLSPHKLRHAHDFNPRRPSRPDKQIHALSLNRPSSCPSPAPTA